MGSLLINIVMFEGNVNRETTLPSQNFKANYVELLLNEWLV